MSITVLAALDLARLADRLDPATTILFQDRVDLASRLVALAETLPERTRTLDLVGLTGSDHLLTFHDRALDAERRLVRAFWREIADLDLVARLGIESVRLIGCSTAVGPRARATIAMLSDVLGVPVVGSYELVSFADFHPTGFEFPETTRTGAAFLDLDSLRARPVDDGARPITAAMGRELLAQIRRRNGVHQPDLLARSSASLAIPSAVDGLFHHVEVMLDHELVRTGDVVFPVDDPRGLRLLLD